MTAAPAPADVAVAITPCPPHDHDGEAGNAVVEFLAVTLILLVPIVYLVLVLGQVQAAAFAVDGAAREAVRAFSTAGDDDDAAARAVAAVALALEDQGFDPDRAADVLTLTCSDGACGAPGSTVTAAVDLDVVLVGVPEAMVDAVPLSVPVGSVATATVDPFTGGS